MLSSYANVCASASRTTAHDDPFITGLHFPSLLSSAPQLYSTSSPYYFTLTHAFFTIISITTYKRKDKPIPLLLPSTSHFHNQYFSPLSSSMYMSISSSTSLYFTFIAAVSYHILVSLVPSSFVSDRGYPSPVEGKVNVCSSNGRGRAVVTPA